MTTSISLSSVNHEYQFEGNSGVTPYQFTVMRTGDLVGSSTVQWGVSLQGWGNWVTAADFQGGVVPSGSLTFAAGETSKVITVNVIGDKLAEFDESFVVNLGSATGATIGRSNQRAEIASDDDAVGASAVSAKKLAIGGNSLTTDNAIGAAGDQDWYGVELVAGTTYSFDLWGSDGDTLNPLLRLLNGSGQQIASDDNSLGWSGSARLVYSATTSGTYFLSAQDATGTGIGKYDLKSYVLGQDDFTGGLATTATLALSGNAVDLFGNIETAGDQDWYKVYLKAGNNYTFADGVVDGLATTLRLLNSGGAQLALTTSVGDLEGEINYSATTSGYYYLAVQGTSGTGQYGLWGEQATIDYNVSSSVFAITAHSSPVQEGNGGTSPYVFLVTRDGVSSAAATVHWALAGTGTNAASAADFVGGVLPSGTVSFAAGQASAFITVNVAGDTLYEADETFAITLSAQSTGSLATGYSSAVGVIRSDDGGGTVNADTITGSVGADFLSGLSGDDSLVGLAGNDTLRGGDGDDTLNGGSGNDLIDGGLGYNRATYQDASGAVTVNLGTGIATGADGTDALVSINYVRGSAFNDTLTGSNNPTDVQFDTEEFEGGAGNDVIDGKGGYDYVRYNNSTAAVTVNLLTGTATGNASVGADTLSNIEGVRGSNYADRLTGGNVANDNFEFFQGLGGNDTINGATGYDRADYTQAGAGVTVTLGGAGNGTAVGDASVGKDTLISIEAVRGSKFADTLTGSDNASIFESFEGREGNDTIDGRGGNDRVEYHNGLSGVTVNLTTGTASDGYGTTDTLRNVENVRGSDFNDGITGSAANNGIDGRGGDDTISGLAGNDDLYGGDGNDSLLGGAGNDRLRGGAGNDTLDGGIQADRIKSSDLNWVDYAASTAGVIVNLVGITGVGNTGAGTANDGMGGTDTLLNISSVRGSAHDDRLTGSNALIFEHFEGGLGDDTIDGGAITDTLNLSNQNRMSYEFAAGAVNVNLATGQTSGADGHDTLININQVRGSSSGDTLTGSNRSNVIETFEGFGGADTIDGAGGYDVARYGGSTSGVNVDLSAGTASDGYGTTDVLLNIEGVRGSLHDDTLTGGNKAHDSLESFDGDQGNDTIDGGSGYDRADYNKSTAGIHVTLGGALAGTATGDASVGSDMLISIEAVRGSAFADVLTGSDAAAIVESFEGREGNDTIDGRGGVDRVDYQYSRACVTVNLATGQASDGWGGTDTLSHIENIAGSRYGDTLTGSSANNVIDGGAGSDTMAGGLGNDTYHVNATADLVTELVGQGTDLIQSTVSYSLADTDSAGLNGGNVENLRLMGSGNLNATGNALANVIYANGGVNSIDGSGGIDTISFQYLVSTGATGVTLNLSLLNAAGQATAGGIGGADLIKNIENITGSNYADTLTGNAGANTLNGGAGSDTLDGGTGNDIFRFSNALGSSNVDRINNYVVANDSIQLENSIFAKLTATGALSSSFFVANTAGTAVDADDYLVYETDTGKLLYDADGNGVGTAVQIALIGVGLSMTSAEFSVT